MRLILVLAAIIMAVQASAAADAQPTGALSPEETKEGFKSLFDGRSLDGWQGTTDGYEADNGLLICKKKGGGRLSTTREYGDFVLRFEFRLEPGANNGVAIRSPLEGKASYQGMEIQIYDDSADTHHQHEPYQAHGSIYGVVPARQGALRPVGQWNEEEIMARGSHVRVTVSGQVVVDADLDKIDKTPDGRAHPGLHRKKGYLGFVGHNSRVAFRNIRVKEL